MKPGYNIYYLKTYILNIIFWWLFQVYSQCQITLKIPKSILYGPDLLVMGLPWRANAYYLLMQLDNNLMPLFYLLEVHTDGEDRSNADATSDAKEAVRFTRIDIGQMQIDEDECSANLLNVNKFQVLQSMLNCRSMEDRSPRKSEIDESLPLKTSFSSIVNAVLGLGCEQGSPSKENQLSYSLPSTHLSSLEVGLQGVSGTNCTPELDDALLNSNIDREKIPSDVSLNSDPLSNLKSAHSTETSGSVPAGDPSKLPACISDHDLSSYRSRETMLLWMEINVLALFSQIVKALLREWRF